MANNLFRTVPDHYTVLEIRPHATENEIKTAYRRLSGQLHPDKLVKASVQTRAAGEETAKRLNEAYEILSNPLACANYNRNRPRNTSEQTARARTSAATQPQAPALPSSAHRPRSNPHTPGTSYHAQDSNYEFPFTRDRASPYTHKPEQSRFDPRPESRPGFWSYMGPEESRTTDNDHTAGTNDEDYGDEETGDEEDSDWEDDDKYVHEDDYAEGD
jgi:curved DNA-binding protein CbpA